MDEVNKRNYDTQQRRDMADKGEALPDGSFPIADKVDLGNALQSIGRAGNRTIALAHIRRRAKALGAEDMLPDWAVAKSVVSPLSIALGVLLADSYSVYHEAHGFHWNVKGADFSQYHDLFSAITDDIYESIDPIAENMLKINADAPFRMSELASMRTVPESSPANDPQAMATALLAQIDGLLNTLKRTFDVAISQNEQGIANFLSERIDSTQKWAWQLRASAGVQKADMLVLERLYPHANMTFEQWNLLVDEVVKAGSVKNVNGYAADVIAKAAKQSFGGNRSAAAQYAANVRWGHKGGKGGTSTAAGPKSSSPADSGGAAQGMGAKQAARAEILSDVPDGYDKIGVADWAHLAKPTTVGGRTYAGHEIIPESAKVKVGRETYHDSSSGEAITRPKSNAVNREIQNHNMTARDIRETNRQLDADGRGRFAEFADRGRGDRVVTADKLEVGHGIDAPNGSWGNITAIRRTPKGAVLIDFDRGRGIALGPKDTVVSNRGGVKHDRFGRIIRIGNE